MHIELYDYEEAKKILEEVKEVFKSKEQFLEMIECDLLLVAINLELDKKANIKEYSQAYQRVIEAAKVLGLNLDLQGRLIG